MGDRAVQVAVQVALVACLCGMKYGLKVEDEVGFSCQPFPGHLAPWSGAEIAVAV